MPSRSATSTVTCAASPPNLMALSTTLAIAPNKRSRSPVTEYALLPAHVDSAATLLRHRVKELYDVVRDLCEIHRAKCRASIVALDLRDSQQRGEHPQHGIKVRYSVADQCLVAGAISRLVASLLETCVHA